MGSSALRFLIDMTRSDIRRGYRNAGIGAAVGLGLRVALDAVLGRGPVGFSPAIVVHSAAAAMIGAAFGMLTSLARITRRKREATGTDSGTRRRIIRV